MEDVVARKLRAWFAANARELAWRDQTTTPWGVLVSEVMSQQTPVGRVEPRWLEWMRRWPTPKDLAEEKTSEILKAWQGMGYPRRALRLKQAASAIVESHGGEVPRDVESLLALPGVGDYTARAVAAFAYGISTPVVDTNIRRVVSRVVHARFLVSTAKAADRDDVARFLDPETGAATCLALMELGAIVCTAKNPRCDRCPITNLCGWHKAGCPAPSSKEMAQAKKRVQKFTGTDRQVRGLIMKTLAEADQPIAPAAIDVVWPDAAQRARALASLIEDGLAEQTECGRIRLPA